MKRRMLAAGVSLALAASSSQAAVVVTVVPDELPLPVVDVPYALQFAGGSGGRSPHAFFVTAGRLPSGLQMQGDGLLAGTPATEGPYAFNLVALDADGRNVLKTFSGEVDSGAPTAEPQTLEVLEDQDLAITFTATDINDTSFGFDITEMPAHGSVSGSGAARIYEAAPDYFGADALQFTASDTANTSAPALVGITVLPVNDAPAFVAGPDVVALRSGGAVTQPGWATGISAGPVNEAAQQLQFVVTVNTRPALFSVPPAVAPDGTLSFTPSGTVGSAAIGLELRDDAGTANGGVDRSTAQFFTIVLQSAGADLSAHIDAPDAFVDNTPLQFTVRVENAGPMAAVDAGIDVAMPAELTAVQWTCTPQEGADCTAAGTGDIADAIDLPVNGSVAYTVQALVVANGVGEFTVGAQVVAGPDQEDADPSDDADQHVFRADAIFADGFED